MIVGFLVGHVSHLLHFAGRRSTPATVSREGVVLPVACLRRSLTWPPFSILQISAWSLGPCPGSALGNAFTNAFGFQGEVQLALSECRCWTTRVNNLFHLETCALIGGPDLTAGFPLDAVVPNGRSRDLPHILGALPGASPGHLCLAGSLARGVPPRREHQDLPGGGG